MAGIDQNTLWQLASMILGKPKAQPTTRERATFLRTDPDGTQWVRLPSSNDETPVNGRTLATAKAGDTVEWSIHDGRLSITGNESQPSVGMREVFQTASDIVQPVVARISKVNELAALSKNVADAAQQVANAVNQHFFSDTNGIHVTEATQEDWNEDHEGANVLLNAAGQLFRDGLVNLLTLTTQNGARALTVWDGLGNAASNIRAIIGETIQLGNASSGNVLTLDTSGMKVSSSSANDMMSLGLGLRAQEVLYYSDSTISSVPHALTLSYTPQGGSIVVYQGIGISYNPPEGESTYQYTISGKTLTITDSRLVGYKYLVRYTATDFEAVSLAVGSYVKADGARTIASGTGSQALGENSLASGYYAKAFGKASHAEGEQTEAAGWAAHAEGGEATASGNFSHAEGYKTIADGSDSHAEGSYATASGWASHAGGHGTVAASAAQTAIGEYNDNNPNNAFEIGNGSDELNRSNAFSVDWDGNVECAGTITPTASSSTVTATTANATIISAANHCWTNNATTTITVGVNLKSSLANQGLVQVATAPSGYRPPYTVVGSVYVTGQVVNLQAWIDSNGAISVNNRSGTSVTTSANIYLSFTFAP